MDYETTLSAKQNLPHYAPFYFAIRVVKSFPVDEVYLVLHGFSYIGSISSLQSQCQISGIIQQ